MPDNIIDLQSKPSAPVEVARQMRLLAVQLDSFNRNLRLVADAIDAMARDSEAERIRGALAGDPA
jgi:hypothetical protein